MMRRLALVALLCAASSSCYTVLRHPPVEPEAAELVEDDVYASEETDRCSACHSDWELEQFDYAFHPIYIPVGVWEPWYCEPWWVNEVPPVRVGTQVPSGAGMVNDRPAGGGGGGGGVGAGFQTPGVWIPTNNSPAPGVVIVPTPTSGPKPQAGGQDGTTNPGPKPEAGASNPDRSALDAGRSTDPKVADPKPATPTEAPRPDANDASRNGTSTTAPRSGESQDTRRSGQSAPAPRSGESQDTSRSGQSTPAPRSGESNDASRSGSSTTPPRPNESPPAANPAPKPDQGRGMTNSRGRSGE
jgi:hypothetical protein